MRIAFIAPFQGPGLVDKRPSLGNLSLAARVKIGLLCELLQRSSHQVEILSQGEIIEHEFKYYPGFLEPEPFHPDIPIHYASALPIRRLNGAWSGWQTLRLFKERHRASPYDLAIVYNLKLPQIMCGNHALQRLGIPVVLEYEDDAFVDIWGRRERSFSTDVHEVRIRKFFSVVSGCVGVSPYLLSQLPPSTPKLLLRGVVGDAFVGRGQEDRSRKNRVVFSGTHEGTQGIEQLVAAWRMLDLPGWELHLAGQGPITNALQRLAQGDPSIVFHGLLSRDANARLLFSARIGMNPQDLTQTPGNVFAFKIVEYLAAGLHVITTPRGALEPELEAGVSYIDDNQPAAIAAALKDVIGSGRYERTARAAALQTYGPDVVSRAMNAFIARLTSHGGAAARIA
jgi:glycosyltransferase involved in cell wall biosynthesis